MSKNQENSASDIAAPITTARSRIDGGVSPLFELADQLRELREAKREAEQTLKRINAEIEAVDYRLSELMTESETQNFTRAGTMFCLTTKTRASATAGRKDELYPPCGPRASATSCTKR